MARPARSRPPFARPRVLMAVGFRDQDRRVTFMPHSDVEQGTLGWELLIDGKTESMLIYVIPYFDRHLVEIRCHATAQQYPDPVHDRLLGTVPIPDDMVGQDS